MERDISNTEYRNDRVNDHIGFTEVIHENGSVLDGNYVYLATQYPKHITQKYNFEDLEGELSYGLVLNSDLIQIDEPYLNNIEKIEDNYYLSWVLVGFASIVFIISGWILYTKYLQNKG